MSTEFAASADLELEDTALRASSQLPGLRLLSFSDLTADIEKFISAARLPAKKAAWQKLRDLTVELKSRSEGRLDPTSGDPWHLTSVMVVGYQGATNQVIMKVDPSPGVTIIHGPNGSGKSTIADGVRTALAGSTKWWTSAEQKSSRSKMEPLWEKIHAARDAEKTVAEVVLSRKGEELALTCLIDSSGEVVSHDAQWTLSTGEVMRVDLRDTAWSHALAGHPPVFAYADIERRVQQSKDLREYIENLLAFGGCFVVLSDRVTDLSEKAALAKKSIDEAAKEAKNRIAHVDEVNNKLAPEASIGAVNWPTWISNIDTWLEENKLNDSGGFFPQITERHSEILSAALTRTSEAFQGIDSSPDSVKRKLANSLRGFHEHVVDLDSPGTECPVCESEQADWPLRLHKSVSDLADLEPLHLEAESSLSELKRSLETELRQVVSVLRSSTTPIATSQELLDRAQSHADELCQLLDRYGCQPTGVARRMVLELCSVLETRDWWRACVEATSLSALDKQWRLKRKAAVADFVSAWRENAEVASEYQLWKATDVCLKDLTSHLRNKRSQDFTALAGGRVKELLDDAGVVLEDVRLTTQRAEVTVQNSAGQPLSLSMLSAGQRNAFLLAPLLATIESGPFGFLVLDDPVHAFDDIRVDRLAAVLAEISLRRRVLVFTHDERLKAHLMARSLNCHSWAISRDLETGVISLESTDELWRMLLDDAENIRSLAPKVSVNGYLTETQIIRGLLRQAIDIALHQAVVRHALSGGRDVVEDLALLDSCQNTVSRFDKAEEVISVPNGDKHPVSEAKFRCGIYLRTWNNAVHGSSITKNDLKSEIDVARKACADLAGS
ncbi:AAA family ATPase [Streptomyces caniscabiei]|uniref:ATP-binding protein n=1 Tax=Streptomyces caniscabiei TaxID=2746961 RepID=UPI0029AB6183|nr:AAA family ATPase [Streptomyces caniscabiei]MDX2601661.1 AAA family ATPase [Streptomyces caniscabiei]MDX2737096.1 AAA family ATPase [Streptomyces caniscabiei]MDX2777857.1 AAA family ATPase [Streptomyces caniscabiei]